MLTWLIKVLQIHAGARLTPHLLLCLWLGMAGEAVPSENDLQLPQSLKYQYKLDPEYDPTYRFTQYAFAPEVTLGYAARGRNSNPNAKTNHAFGQTSLQLNPSRFAGFSNFNIYGQALDPETTAQKKLSLKQR